MKRWLLLLFIVACTPKMCPEGFVSAVINESSACVSSLSYCISDDQCTSAQFDCKRPCAHLPVNVLFSSKAREKAQACDVSSVRCKQVPFVDNRCVENQCVSVPHTAEELIPQPNYQEVVPGKVVCYERKGSGSILRLNVSNNVSIPLQQLEAYVNISLRNGSWAVAQVDLLNKSLLPNESVAIHQPIIDGIPMEISISVVRPVVSNAGSFGMVNEDAIVNSKVSACATKDS